MKEVEKFFACFPKSTSILFSLSESLSDEEEYLLTEYNSIMLFKKRILSPCLFLFADDTITIHIGTNNEKVVSLIENNISFFLKDIDMSFSLVGVSNRV